MTWVIPVTGHLVAKLHDDPVKSVAVTSRVTDEYLVSPALVSGLQKRSAPTTDREEARG